MEQEKTNSLVLVSKDVVKATLDTEAAKVGYLALQEKANNLQVSEDNLEDAKLLIEQLMAVNKVIEQKHTEGKAQYLLACQAYDEAKREALGLVNNLLHPLQIKYRNICISVENRRKEQQAQELRKQTIQKGIENNLVSFAQKIAGSETQAQLEEIKQVIEAEQKNGTKYMEFLSVASEKYATLLTDLESRREIVKELEAAVAEKPADTFDSLISEQNLQNTKSRLQANSFKVQDNAITQAMNTLPVETATEVLPDVKARRKQWKWEIKDPKVTVTLEPTWVQLNILAKPVLDHLRSLRESGALDNTEEVHYAGIRFYLDKQY